MRLRVQPFLLIVFIGQRDVQFKHGTVRIAIKRDVDGILIDFDIATNHFQQFAFQHRHIIRLATLTALMGHDDLKALLGNGCRLLALASQEIE
ncbi:flagellar biosynthesis pathway, component [Zymobacter palmae]|uniref:Flagellar biosynthesis pathway, component n=1 Tax=Zymobacter palmae TaxID=33074 RepID=A0A348HC72_9GAMM|nr:flagellar biosynthesis pathway, component [Zymobacter palmae]